MLELCAASNKVIDTKKPYLDNMVRDYVNKKQESEKLFSFVSDVLNKLSDIFIVKDNLLRSQGSIPIFYLVAKDFINKNIFNKFTRSKLQSFYDKISENRTIAEEDIGKSKFEFLEYDRLSQQGTNDASSIRERVRILSEFLQGKLI